jgi:hypothetical protein
MNRIERILFCLAVTLFLLATSIGVAFTESVVIDYPECQGIYVDHAVYDIPNGIINCYYI